MLLTKCC